MTALHNGHATLVLGSGPAYRIHVTGAARSGTTLMLALMLNCFAIDGQQGDECRIWRARVRGRRIVCTKHPGDERFAMLMARLDPRLHVIWLLRDPREVIVSRHGKVPERYFTNLAAWRRSAQAARPHLHRPNVHLVRYDALVRDPDKVQRELAAAMPFLKITRPFSRYHEMAQETTEWKTAMHDVRPVSTTSLGSWRKHLPRVVGQMQCHGALADDLIDLGFERHKGWLQLLKDVEPDTSPSVGPAQLSLRKRFDGAWRDLVGACGYGLQRLGVRR